MIVFAVLALAVAAGLVALGRWTAPAASTGVSRAEPVREACGTMAPTTMPTQGCRSLLTRMYLGAPADVPCGTMMPTVMPSPACQRVLEEIYLGTR
jgi:hypothetical protein